MRERPILFSGPMVRAILEGRKTMTRRAVKLQTAPTEYPQGGGAKFVQISGKQYWWNSQKDHPAHVTKACPYGQPGDRLWVREAFSQHPQFADLAYRADGEEFEDSHGFLWEPKWKPSIHMPRSASRILLEITAVRVERLHDISEADAQAEGVERVVVGSGWRRYCDPDSEEVGVPPCGDARRSFRSLWKYINGAESWNSNPWVWVVEFKRVQP